jgi:hypothetical protein
MNCHAYILIHKGHYLGGVIIVVEENLQRAKERIENELLSAGLTYDDYNLDEVKPIDLKSPSIVYFESGDY